MTSRFTTLAVSTAMIGAMLGLATQASAQNVMQQCSTKYQAAKLVDPSVTWTTFLPACRAELKAQPAAAPAPVAPAPVAPKPTVAAPVTNPLKPPVAAAPVVPVAPVAPVAASTAVFPAAIAAAYASEKAGIGRRKTCDDQYKANKATNANGGMKWIEKGGGYYSACNKHLKG